VVRENLTNLAANPSTSQHAAPAPAPTFDFQLFNQKPYARLMSATDFNIRYVAQLARIELTPGEEQRLGAQLSNILGYIEKLKELDVSRVEPTAHAVPLFNVTRPDEPLPGLTNDEALRNAPASANGLFIVPKIVE